MERLKVLQEDVRGCTECKLHKTRTRAVPGVGSATSDVVFIGEAPGRTEDARGEPFVGAAGQMLSWALEAAGSSREKVYITNVVKCRPPENRVPDAGERKACRRHLDGEMEIIRPKIICIMGNTAFGSMLGRTGIGKVRGKVCRMDGQLYFLTVHPAATLYNRDLVGVLNADIARLFEILGDMRSGRDVRVDIEYTS